MNDNEFFEILCEKINYIIIDNNEYRGTFDIKSHIDKYSALKKLSMRMFMDNKVIKTKKTLVNYNCPTCNRVYTILLKRFLTKKSLNCKYCKEQIYDKRKKQSEFISKSFFDFNKIVPKEKKIHKEVSNKELIEMSNILFNNESDEFKKNYFKNHLTDYKFKKIRKNIISVKGIEINNDWIYCEHVKNNNQIKYSSYLYDLKNDIFINFNDIMYICENCDNVFRTSRNPIERTSNYKCLCFNCSFSNKTFKIRNILNINGDKVTYQSNPELKLIKYCNSNNVEIKNGPTIYYYFSNKKRKYYVDFYIPSKNMIIEIKDNHIWHKKQVGSGLWFIKEKTAIKYAKENNLKFKLIFTRDLQEFIDTFKI